MRTRDLGHGSCALVRSRGRTILVDTGIGPDPTALLGKARRLRGQAFLAEGRLIEAQQELTIALDIAVEIGNPPQLWKTHAALGELHASTRRACVGLLP